MEEIKQVGRVGIAVGIWLAIIWVFSKPKRIIILVITLTTLVFAVSFLLDDTGKLYYVNINKLELYEQPFGNPSITLVMNDTLRMVGKFGNDWTRVAIGTDTLYLKDRFIRHDELGSWAVIQSSPFTI